MKWFLVYILLIFPQDSDPYSVTSIVSKPDHLKFDATTMEGCFRFREYILKNMLKEDLNGQQLICIKHE